MKAVAMLMRAAAIKKGQGQEKAAGFEEMGTLRCDGCGEEFFIVHHPAFADHRTAGLTRTRLIEG